MGHVEIACLVLQQTANLFSREAVAFYIPTCDRSSFSTSSQALGTVTIFFFSFFSLLIDVQECLIEVLICASLMLNIFPCAYLPSVFPFHWNESSCPFSILFFFFYCCVSRVLYILYILAFCWINSLQIFSPNL